MIGRAIYFTPEGHSAGSPGGNPASEVPPHETTVISRARVEDLVPAVYDQLRALAQRALASERVGHTLQATALVHEAFVRLAGERRVPWASEGHYYVAAAEAMRRVLLDHARAKGRVKRGGGAPAESCDFSSVADLADAHPETIVRFDEHVQRLGEEVSNEAAMVVRLRFFAGLSVDQAAAALGISPATVDRRWVVARAWLLAQMRA